MMQCSASPLAMIVDIFLNECFVDGKIFLTFYGALLRSAMLGSASYSCHGHALGTNKVPLTALLYRVHVPSWLIFGRLNRP
jgi:hypothetical protein